MDLFIKNMVCNRCILTIEHRLNLLSIPFCKVELGRIITSEPLTAEQARLLRKELQEVGFELLDDQKASLIAQIKACIIKHIHGNDESLQYKKLSAILAETLSTDYNYLSSLFSSFEGLTIEKYVILQRIERAKELLTYNEMNLNEIADQLCYSSVQHLSQQFKKITGLTPSQYKQDAREGRKPLDQVGS